MYKELVGRNVWIIIISLVTFFLISLSVISIVGNKNLTEDLLGLTTVFTGQLNGCQNQQEMHETVDEFTAGQDWFNVYIVNQSGQVLISNDNAHSVEGAELYLSDYEINALKDLVDYETYMLARSEEHTSELQSRI